MSQEPLQPRRAFDTLTGGENFIYLKRQSAAECKMKSRGLLALSLVIAISWLARLAVAFVIPGIYDRENTGILVFSFLFFITLGFAVYQFLIAHQKNSAFGITDQGVYYRYGFLNESESVIWTREISKIKIGWRDFHARKHNYGKITLTLDSDKSVVIAAVENPENFLSLVEANLT